MITITSCLESLRLMIPAGVVTELRMPKTKRATIRGYYDDLATMAKDAARFDGRVSGIYFVPNPVEPSLLALSKNHLEEYARESTQDTDILRRCWLLVDFDPIRKAGISSTDEEHQAALDAALQAREFLRRLGWPDPVYADSGNGAHLDYLIDLPVHDSGLVQRVLEALAKKFDSDMIKVDQGNFNPARIWKLYGTLAAKGDPLPNRPHRRSLILEAPDKLVTVTETQLKNFAGGVPAAAKSRTNGLSAGLSVGHVRRVFLLGNNALQIMLARLFE
jgi:hypothetical protein